MIEKDSCLSYAAKVLYHILYHSLHLNFLPKPDPQINAIT